MFVFIDCAEVCFVMVDYKEDSVRNSINSIHSECNVPLQMGCSIAESLGFFGIQVLLFVYDMRKQCFALILSIFCINVNRKQLFNSS